MGVAWAVAGRCDPGTEKGRLLPRGEVTWEAQDGRRIGEGAHGLHCGPLDVLMLLSIRGESVQGIFLFSVEHKED
jgi:hypothetical protein